MPVEVSEIEDKPQFDLGAGNKCQMVDHILMSLVANTLTSVEAAMCHWLGNKTVQCLPAGNSRVAVPPVAAVVVVEHTQWNRLLELMMWPHTGAVDSCSSVEPMQH